MQLSSNERFVVQTTCVIGLLGILQYLVMTTWLMQIYPGGHLGHYHAEGYSFTQNFLSDLGRTSQFARGYNPTAPFYRLTLATAGVCTMIFFGGLCYVLAKSARSFWVFLCLLSGVFAGIGYIGIAWHPINVDYWSHIRYVQVGFIAFWIMTVTCGFSIQRGSFIPHWYARMLFVFAAVLGAQIAVMLLGPRSWSSGSALYLQVIAQKVVVYTEIAAMLVLTAGTFRTVRAARPA